MWAKDQIRVRPCSWLVTGVAGFIGSHLLRSLLKLGQQVTGLDDFSSGSRDNLAMVQADVGADHWHRFRLVEGDIGSLEACREACRGAQLVLHQAALDSVSHSIGNPLQTHRLNVTGFLHVLEAARAAGVKRFVYASSSASYGDDPAERKIESQVGRQLSPYGLSKLVDEMYAEVFARCYGLECIGLRYFNVFGPRQDPKGAYAAVIPGWICRMLLAEPVYINGDGQTSRDFCYVDDVVQANLLAALVDDPEAVNQVYNVGLGEKTTLDELFIAIRTLIAQRLPRAGVLRPEYRDFRPGDVRCSQADIGKARRLLGYRPAWPVGDGLAETIAWYEASLAPRRRSAEVSTLPMLQAAIS